MAVEPALRHTLLERIISDSTDAIVALDPNEHVVLWNDGARQMFGYTSEEMLGRLWSALVPPSGPERRRYRRIRDRLARDGHVDNVKTVRLARGGRRVPVLLTRTLLRSDGGEILGSAIVAKGLADLEEIERRLARSDKLAAIGQLVAHLAHEVRNPLNTVVLNYEMLRSSLEADRPADAGALSEHLDIIASGLSVLERSVSDFLRLARDAPARSEPVSLPVICKRVVRLLEREAAQRRVHLAVTLSDDTPLVLADPDRVEHVLMNLVRNAMEAVEQDGEVRIAARRRRRRVHLQVSDTGPGMDEETRRRAFAPFFSTKPAGTGLGLAIVERLVHEMQGDVRCESAPGRGTTVTVVLPTATEGTAS